MRLFRLPRITAAAVGGAAASLGWHAWSDAAASLAESSEKADAAPTCLHMHLHHDSTVEVLRRFPPAHERTLGERVLIRPCVEAEKETTPLRVLAYACDGLSQSLLVAVGETLWSKGAALHPGGVGYPMVPISLASVPEPEERDVPPALDAQQQPGSAVEAASGEVPEPTAAGVGAGGDGEDDEDDEDFEVRTFVSPAWEQAEGLWQRLEASGVLEVERDDEALPVALKLSAGGSEWSGVLRGGATERPVEVRLFGVGGSDAWELAASTAAPECGFCRFMKAGPCGAQFVAWEACIEHAKSEKADFVELCTQQTLGLKGCTDKHPEYYGALGGGYETDGAKDDAPQA